jgi:Acetyltransferase (GNAT) family.
LAEHTQETERLLTQRGVAVLAFVGNEPVGFAEISVRVDHVEGALSSPTPCLEGWYVGQTFRRRGVGRGLLRRAEQWARDAGFTEIGSDAKIDKTRSSSCINAHAHVSRRGAGFSRSGPQRSVHKENHEHG